MSLSPIIRQRTRFRAVFAWAAVCLLMVFKAAAQDGGGVSGVVINSFDGKPIPGATVTVRGTTLAAQTDSTGRFELKNLPAGDQVLRMSKSSFAAAVVTDVRVISGQITTVNGNLRPEFYEMEEFEVTAEEFVQQTEQIMIDRQESSSMVDALGSEQFSKLGASDASQIIGRVTGVTVVGGKFAVVRGLSDRYTRTLLNGAEVPSADPYRTSPQLDMFPAGMIDQVTVSKTFTPDQPGGTGGGTIDVVTKSFPEKPFVKFSAGTSYNENSNLKKNFLADPASSMAMYDIPSGPSALEEQYFNLNAAPAVPGPASSAETATRAATRRQQADAQANLLKSLGTANFAGVSQSSPLNSSLSASAGKTFTALDRPLGTFAAMNYGRNFRFAEDIKLSRSNNRSVVDKSGTEDLSNIVTDYGVNFNLGYEVTETLELGFNYLLAHTADEEARHTTYDFLQSSPGETLEQWQLHFTEREINNYQFRTKLGLPEVLNSELDAVLNLAKTTQNEPDHRFMNYFLDEFGNARLGDAGLPVPQFPSRYFREIEEESMNTKLDWKVPFELAERESSLKTGAFLSQADRTFREQYFGYSQSSGFTPTDPNSYLNNPAYLDYTTTYLGGIRTNYNFSRAINLATGRPYTASSEITAGYLMADLSVLSWLRLIGGARVEQTKYDIDAFREGKSKLDQTDLLPAISCVVTLSTNLSLRLSYAETVSRPSFRELSPILNYLPDRNVFARGNPELKMASIKSYDARLEWFPSPGELLSAGVFYKQLRNPIELYQVTLDGDDVTWVNRDEATLMGLELEARKSLRFISQYLDGFTFGANITVIKSETALTASEYANKTDVDGDGNIDFPTSPTRPLYDQSPYVVNLDLSYDRPASGTSLTLSANLTGERIALATAQGNDLYEHPPITLDAGITQKIGKHMSVRLGVRNLLDSEYRQTYGSNADGDLYQSYRRGRTFSLSLTAEF